jgi:hypothetical protein
MRRGRRVHLSGETRRSDRAGDLDYDKTRIIVHEIDDFKKLAKFSLSDGLQQSRGVQARNSAGTSDPLSEAFSRATNESARLLAVYGRKQGDAPIRAMDDRRNVKETLGVGVHPHTELKLNFIFPALINGSAKPTPLSKSRFTSDVKKWIGDLNGIFKPQANISFKSHVIKEPPVPRYSGSYKDAQAWTNEIGHLRETADANVFLVGSWKGIGDDGYKDPYGSYIISTRDIVCDDRPSYDFFMTTLAHEVGHFLGYRRNLKFGHPDGDKKHYLMTTVNWRNGMKIPRQYVLDFNPKR